jgi:aldose 1-epimerase
MSEQSPASVTLRDEDEALEATFVPAAGMLCCSLRHRGEELLAQNAGVEAYTELGKTMGIPLLYPWANRLAAFDYALAGRVVRLPHDSVYLARDPNGLPIHGVIGGRMKWHLEETPDRGARSLLARLCWDRTDPERFALFPFPHDLTYEASLAAGSLTIAVTVHASGEDPVPLAFGFHPYLSIPGAGRERWRIELPGMRHLVLDTTQIPSGTAEEHGAHCFELAERVFDDGFTSVRTPARFGVEGERRRIALEFLEGYACAQVYAPSGGQFICFEPMVAPTNALRSGAGLRVLEPGESHRAVFSVTVEELGRS